MHPYHHAVSSAKIFGGRWEDYAPVHHWFDATKISMPHFLHRALRHHKEGISEASRIFKPINGISIEAIGNQHMQEDCGLIPSASDWFKGHHIDLKIKKEIPSLEELCQKSSIKFGGDLEDYKDLHSWFLQTEKWIPEPSHLILRHHSFGIFEAEEKFGILYKNIAPTRILAESHVSRTLGSIKSASHYLIQLSADTTWMNNPKKSKDI